MDIYFQDSEGVQLHFSVINGYNKQNLQQAPMSAIILTLLFCTASVDMPLTVTKINSGFCHEIEKL